MTGVMGMLNEKKGWLGLSARNWMVLLLFFVAIYVNRVSAQNFTALFFGVRMPFVMRDAVDQLRDRDLTAAPAWRLHAFAAAWLVVTTLLNWRVDYEWLLKLWYVVACWFYMGFAPRNADADELRRQLFTVGMLFVCGLLPLFLLALASIFTGRLMYVPFIDNPIGIQKTGKIGGYITILQHHNVDARFAAFCVLFSVYGIITRKSRVLRAFLGFDILVSLMVLAHTQSRSSGIGLSLALGALAFRAAYLRFAGKRWRMLAAALAVALTFAVVLSGVNLIYRADIRVGRLLKADQRKADGSLSAKKKATNAIQSHADKSGQFGMFSNGRDKIWLDTLTYLKDHPRCLITGIGGTGDASYAKVVAEHERIAKYTGYHNSYLTALAIGGLPALLAMLAFLCLMVRPCLRVLLHPGEGNRGLCVVPAFILMLVLVAVPEQIILVRAGYANLLFYFMCGIARQADWLIGKE